MEKTDDRNRKCSDGQLLKLIEQYEKLVFSICYKITGDYFTAEDLAQETFLTVYQKYGSFDGENEKAWICRIATNKSIDYIRSGGSRNIPTEENFFGNLIEKKENPESLCLEKEMKDRLEQYCGELKPPYDEIARDYYLEEMSAAEIAVKRGSKLKTIQTQIYRARDHLRRIYRREAG